MTKFNCCFLYFRLAVSIILSANYLYYQVDVFMILSIPISPSRDFVIIMSAEMCNWKIFMILLFTWSLVLNHY